MSIFSLSSLLRWTSTLTLAVMPLVVFPVVLYPFVFGKTLFFEVMMFVVTAIFGVLLITSSDARRRTKDVLFHPFTILFFLVLAAQWVS